MSISHSTLHHRNPFVRKGYSLITRLPRLSRRVLAGSSRYDRVPPVLCNSFPKSETHLFVQIAEALPGLTNYGTFLALMASSVRFRERSPSSTLRLRTRGRSTFTYSLRVNLDKRGRVGCTTPCTYYDICFEHDVGGRPSIKSLRFIPGRLCRSWTNSF